MFFQNLLVAVAIATNVTEEFVAGVKYFLGFVYGILMDFQIGTTDKLFATKVTYGNLMLEFCVGV